ncbi:MAG: o-succinylbenzoate synthase [Candidatus Aminicenantes bacterium]|nr:o-succinylbenzoate synthase [Candidatus Aminicenantes bacterium]
MTIKRIQLDLLRLPYVHFFETSFGRSYDRTFILTRVWEGGVCGWGECVAEEQPLYGSETTESAWHILKDFLIPLVFEKALVEPEDFARAAGVYRGNRMAKAGLELALWDLKAKKAGVPLRKLYGGVHDEVEAGVSCGIEDSIPDLIARIGQYLDEGYRRIKIKIKPGWDANACAAVRARYPDILLQADANGAYKLDDKDVLKALDVYNLLLVEQPFAPYDLWDHAKLQKEMKTPLCLDESILSLATARAAVEMGSCRIINIKVGRVGGVVEARAIHDYCQGQGIPVWCGGMLESGVGRAHNLHLASLPNFKLPHDLSASRRYYKEDIIDPFIELSGPGKIRVPDGPGIGVNPVEERVRRAAVRSEQFGGRLT